MLNPNLLPDLDAMKKEMDNYSTLNQLSRHLDDTMPKEVDQAYSYDEDDEEEE